jgi:hypothetical protein
LLGSLPVGSLITQNNDFIIINFFAISNPSVAISILDGFKDKLLSQKEIYNKEYTLFLLSGHYIRAEVINQKKLVSVGDTSTGSAT